MLTTLLIGFVASSTTAQERVEAGETFEADTLSYVLTASELVELQNRLARLVRDDTLRREKISRLEALLALADQKDSMRVSTIEQQSDLLDDYRDHGGGGILDNLPTISFAATGGYFMCEAFGGG